ncbi:hypothetical protein DYH09_03815 [bacterium CPR1]|nr:hypothetical protein [bacterium CPR1]
MTEAVRALGVAGMFLAIFALAELIKRVFHPPAELTRKFVHFAGGLVVAAFPWLLRSPWTVLALSCAFGGILWLSRRLGLLSSVHGVARRSQGGLYYPLAVFLLFWLSADQPAFYLVSAIALVLSDTLAALVGTAYGRHPYAVEQDTRSLEGSAVFFLTTFLGVHLPLLLMTDLDRRLIVLVALIMALLLTAFEAISLEGNDNLIVPLASYFMLVKATDKTVAHLTVQLAALLGCLAVTLLMAWKLRTFSLAGAVGASLVLFGSFSLGGPLWAVPPLAALVAYLLLRRRFPDRHQILAVFYVCLVPTLVLLGNNALTTGLRWPGDPLFFPFVGAVAAQLAILISLEMPEKPAQATLLGALAVLPLSLFLHPEASGAAWTCLPAVLLAPLIYHGLRRRYGLPEGYPMVRRQALATLLPTAAAAALQLSSSPPGG